MRNVMKFLYCFSELVLERLYISRNLLRAKYKVKKYTVFIYTYSATRKSAIKCYLFIT